MLYKIDVGMDGVDYEEADQVFDWMDRHGYEHDCVENLREDGALYMRIKEDGEVLIDNTLVYGRITIIEE